MKERQGKIKLLPAIIISLGILSIVLLGYTLLIDNDSEQFPNFSMYLVFFIFLFMAIDYLRIGSKKEGYIYAFVALFGFVAVIQDLLNML